MPERGQSGVSASIGIPGTSVEQLSYASLARLRICASLPRIMSAYLFLLVAAVLAAAAPPPPPPLGSKTKWVINYAESYCVLSRDRTPTEPGVAIRTRPFADEHELLFMLEPNEDKPFSKQGKLMVGNRPEGLDRWVGMAVSKSANVRAIETTIKADELTSAISTGRVRILVPDKLDVAVRLPNIEKAGAALQACEADLAKQWKIARTWAINPKPVDARGPIRHEDYPTSMIEAGRMGSVLVLLAIDQTGSVTDCRIIELSGDPIFGKTVCAAFRKRSRFTPALDSGGKPIASNYMAPRVRFMLQN